MVSSDSVVYLLMEHPLKSTRSPHRGVINIIFIVALAAIMHAVDLNGIENSLSELNVFQSSFRSRTKS